MLIVPDHVYNFQFKSLFSALDGIYRVISLLSYAELLDQGIDLHDATYEPHGMSDQFDTDLDKIRSGKLVKIRAVNNPDSIYFIPEHLIDGTPDGSVQQYHQLGLAVDLGIFADAEQLSTIRNEIDQVLSTMLGVTTSSLIYTVDDVWLTKTDYRDLELARQAAVTRISNHYTDKLALQEEVSRLKTLISYYEESLKA